MSESNPSPSARVEEKVFFDLARAIEESNYKITDEEKAAFNKCSTDLVDRFIRYTGGLSIAGYALARALTKPLAGVKPVRNVRAGRAICCMAGGYIGTRIAVQGVRDRCLGHLLELDSPVGNEAEVLLREAAPNNSLLSRRPMHEGGPSSHPRLRDAAALQQAVNQARQASGSDDMRNSAIFDRPRPQAQPGNKYSPPDGNGQQRQSSQYPADSSQYPVESSRYPAETQTSRQQWEMPAKQSEEPWEPQPDAFPGLGGGGVFGAPTGSDSGRLSDDSPTQGSGDGWGELQQDSRQAAGLDTVRRSRHRSHRSFGGGTAESNERSRWD